MKDTAVAAPIQDASPAYQAWLKSFNNIRQYSDMRIDDLIGDMLTLVEIAMPVGQQLVSLKSKIKSEINRFRNDIDSCHWDNLQVLRDSLEILEPKDAPTQYPPTVEA